MITTANSTPTTQSAVAENVHSLMASPVLPGVRRTKAIEGLIGAMAGLTEQDFRVKSDQALEQARRSLMALADQEGFEIELQDGVLNLLFEEPSEARFVVSPNAPVRQIWVSAMARSYKLSWTPDLEAFALEGETLPKLLERLARTHLGS